MREVLDLKLSEELEKAAAAYQQVAESAAWWWPGKYVCFVSDRPVALHVTKDSSGVNRLSNQSGPSIAWADGSAMWHIDGIALDEQIVMRPETQTIEQINRESNSDAKSIRISRFGWPRFLAETKSRCIDRRYNEIEGMHEALFASPTGERRLVVTCPTGRVFAPGVPAEVRTCEEAKKWIHPQGAMILART